MMTKHVRIFVDFITAGPQSGDLRSEAYRENIDSEAMNKIDSVRGVNGTGQIQMVLIA